MTLSPCGQFAKSGPLWIKRIFSRCFKSAFLGYELHVLKRKKPWDRLVVQYLESFEYNKIGSRKIFKDDEITFLSLPSLGFVMLVLFCLHLPPTPPWSALLSWHGKLISLTMCFFFFPFVLFGESLRDSTRTGRFISWRVSSLLKSASVLFWG